MHTILFAWAFADSCALITQLKQLTKDKVACSPTAQQLAVFKAAFSHPDDANGTVPACVYNLTGSELLNM